MRRTVRHERINTALDSLLGAATGEGEERLLGVYEYGVSMSVQMDEQRIRH